MPGEIPDELTLNIAGNDVPYTPEELFELTLTLNEYEKQASPMTDSAENVIGAYELYKTDADTTAMNRLP